MYNENKLDKLELKGEGIIYEDGKENLDVSHSFISVSYTHLLFFGGISLGSLLYCHFAVYRLPVVCTIGSNGCRTFSYCPHRTISGYCGNRLIGASPCNGHACTPFDSQSDTLPLLQCHRGLFL